ncbi:membrane protein insertion efficiency factor YidD [Neorickettsia helminthoeca]|uniref:membrane protein insertion efficiency factor YidD n=1 Tax=Neorickettsia helminthoeca TaxID=33994 RepID=UPI000A037A45|nr:membrane protein insertion efficiency factor YidD [Neorickettsia helminthoeca]
MDFLLCASAVLLVVSVSCSRNPITLCAIWSVKFYRYFISPLKPRCCIYQQSCSEYALEVLRNYSLPTALLLIAVRLLSCHPLTKRTIALLPQEKEVSTDTSTEKSEY